MRMVIQKDKTCFNNRCFLLMKTLLYHSVRSRTRVGYRKFPTANEKNFRKDDVKGRYKAMQKICLIWLRAKKWAKFPCEGEGGWFGNSMYQNWERQTAGLHPTKWTPQLNQKAEAIKSQNLNKIMYCANIVLWNEEQRSLQKFYQVP